MMSKNFRSDVDVVEWTGRQRPYDILKEGAIALLLITILTLTLAIIYGSPDDPSITIKKWSNAAPTDFAMTAVSELNATSTTGSYGPPYNHAATGQSIGPVNLVKAVGVRIPIDTANDFVISPLKALPYQADLHQSLVNWNNASDATRAIWVTNYSDASSKMTFTNGQIVVPTTTAGPVPIMINNLTAMARSGALDESLISNNSFYTTDFTKTLLFISDGSYLSNTADKQHLSGSQWGMMNETGSYPGQAWLWLYSFWYQIPPFNASGNADALVWALMMFLSVLMIFVPFIPGLRSIPRKTRVYRLIWRDHYKS